MLRLDGSPCPISLAVRPFPLRTFSRHAEFALAFCRSTSCLGSIQNFSHFKLSSLTGSVRTSPARALQATHSRCRAARPVTGLLLYTHIQVTLDASFLTSHAPQPCVHQHKSDMTVRKTSDRPHSAPDFPNQPFQRIIDLQITQVPEGKSSCARVSPQPSAIMRPVRSRRKSLSLLDTPSAFRRAETTS